MNPKVKSVEAKENYRLIIRFNNNEIKEFDMTPYLEKGVFKELKDVNYFKKVRVAYGSIAWPNGQDLSSDTLYH